MADARVVREWLTKADEDFNFAKINLEEDNKEHCELLNSAYIDTRYPVHWPTDYSKQKAQRMQAAAASVADTVKDILAKGGIRL
jgi:HEPN domain-containing protein